eukprot:XP_001696734.1 predicted protein [Chlamydomonas reinhardtii]
MQLSLHALSSQLDRLVASRPRAWLEQQLAELQQLLRPADRTEGEGGAGHGSDDALDGLAAELALQGASAEALARLRRLVRARADYAELRSSLAATEARRREAAEAAGRLEGVIEGNRRQAEALAAEYEAQLAALQARHAAEAEQLQSALSSLQLEVQQLQTSRDKCVRLAAASQRLGATAVVHLAAAVPALQQRQELEGERRRRAADQWAAREAAEAAAAELAALRRRHGANLRSWLALKGWVALKMTDVAERAGRLAAEHRAQAASARATVQDLQAQLGAARAQLAAQVRAAVEARGAVSELTELLAGKDADILELEGRLGGAEAALESQRQQAGALAAALTATEESLAAARADSEQLSTALRNAQVATAAAEGRAAELLSANQLLDTQVKQFTDMTADLARIQETYVAPHQARVAALEAQVEHERAVAAAAAAERANELAAMSEDLAEARRWAVGVWERST